MKHYNITKPIGLATPCKEIEGTCSNAHMYERCGLRPKHYIIPLDSGSGRTTLVEYMTDKYKEAGVLSFISGLDDYIEIAFDGSLQQLKQAFAAIDSAEQKAPEAPRGFPFFEEARSDSPMDIDRLLSRIDAKIAELEAAEEAERKKQGAD